MEAVALYNFTPTSNDELGFLKGDNIKIINYNKDEHWLDAQQGDRCGVVPINFLWMRPAPWYHVDCIRDQARDKLLRVDAFKRLQLPDGTFILRSKGNRFSISVKQGNDVLHFRIIRDLVGLFFVWSKRFETLNQLVDFYRNVTISDTDTVFLLYAYTEEADKPKFTPNVYTLGPGERRLSNAKKTEDHHQSPRAFTPPVDTTANAVKSIPVSQNNNPYSNSSNNSSSSSSPQLTAAAAFAVTHNPQSRQLQSENLARPVSTNPFVTTASLKRVRARHTFKSLESDELSFTRGDIITVLQQDTDTGWWMGKLNSKKGLFPANYVEELP